MHTPINRRQATCALAAAATAALSACSHTPTGVAQTQRIDVGPPDQRATLQLQSSGRGTPILFLAGFTLEQSMWDAQFNALAASHRVLRFDERGIGASSRFKDGEKYRDADDIRQVLDAAGVERAHLVGHSRGARRAIDFALSSPAHRARVRSLTLIGPVVGGYPPAADYAKAFGEVIAAARGSATVPADLIRARELWANLYLFESTRQHPAVRRQLADMIRRYDGHFLRTVGTPQSAELPLAPPAAGRLGELAGLPTQVIIGAEEIAFIADMARAITAAVPGARLHTVPGGGHMVNMENPAPVTALVASFVGGLPSA
jgi:3-oxoadipate enol-lactonase